MGSSFKPFRTAAFGVNDSVRVPVMALGKLDRNVGLKSLLRRLHGCWKVGIDLREQHRKRKYLRSRERLGIGQVIRILNVPVGIVVPLMFPVAASRTIPSGSDPFVIDQRYGGAPATAARATEYGTAAVISGSAEVPIVNAGTMVIESVFVAVWACWRYPGLAP